jgi:hypothetical protein
MTKNILLAEIIATEARIRELVKIHGINSNQTLLTILFGADIESRLTEADGNAATPENRESFRTIAYNTIPTDPHQNSPFTEIFDTGPNEEINLTPGTSTTAIENYYAAQKILTSTATAMGHKLRYGKGHWHHSIKQSGQSLYIQDNTLTPFFKAVSKQLLADQIAMPALFVSPSKAERPLYKRSDSAAKHFGIGTNDKQNSINCSAQKYSDGSPSFEMRISHLAPYLPILMILSTVETVLLKNHTMPLRKIENKLACPMGQKIHTGPKSYLKTLAETIQSDIFRQRFGSITEPLAHALITSYRSFLSRPNASYPHNHHRTQQLATLAKYENHLFKTGTFTHKALHLDLS